MSMNFSEFDSTDSEQSVEQSLDKDQLKKALLSGEERLMQTNLLLERAKETIKSLQHGVGTSPIRSSRRGLEASSLASSFADSSVSGDSMSAIQNQLNFITSQMQNLPPKQNSQFVKLKERNALIEKQLSELQDEFQIKSQDFERLELEFKQLKTIMGTTESENQILKDNVRRLQDQVSGYQKRVDDLTNENNTLSERIDDMEDKERSELSNKLGTVNQLKKEIDKLNVQKLDLENKLSSQQTDFEIKFNSTKKAFEIEKVEQKSDYEQKISTLKLENSNIIKMLQGEIDSLTDEKKEMIEKFNSEKLEMNQKFKDEKKLLTEKHNDDKKQLFEKSSVDRNSVLEQLNAEKIKLMQDAINDKNDMIERHKLDMENLSEKHRREIEQYVEKMRIDREKFNEEKDTLLEKHSKEKEAQVEKLTNSMKEKEDLIKEKERLVYKYNNELNNNNEKFKAEIEILKSTFEKNKQLLLKEFEAEKKESSTIHQEEINSLKNRYENQIELLQLKTSSEKEDEKNKIVFDFNKLVELEIEKRETEKQSFEQEKKRLISDFEKELKTQKTHMEQLIDEKEKTIKEKSHDIQKLKEAIKERDEEIKQHELDKSRVSNDVEKHKDSNEVLKQAHKREIDSVEAKYSQLIDNIKHEHDIAIMKLKESFEREKADLKIEYVKLESDIQNVKEQHEYSKKALQHKYEDDLKRATENFELQYEEINAQMEKQSRSVNEQVSAEKRQKALLESQYEKLLAENQQLTKKLVSENTQSKFVEKNESNTKKQLVKIHKDHLNSLESLKSSLRFSSGDESDVRYIRDIFFKELDRLKKVVEQSEESNYIYTAEEMKGLKEYCIHLEGEITTLVEQNRQLVGKVRNITKSLATDEPKSIKRDFNDSISTSNSEDDRAILDQSIINQNTFDEQMELLNKVATEALQDSDEKILQFLQNVFVPSEKHDNVIEIMNKKHSQMKKILQMEYWTSVRKLRLKPNSSVSKVPKAKKAFSNAIDRMDVFFMSQISTLTMAEDARDFNTRELEKMYEGEVSRARSFVNTTTDTNDRLITQQEFAIESTKEYVQEQERQLSSLSDAVRRIDLQSDKQNEKNILKQCLLQIEALYKEDRNTIRAKMFKAINESNNSSADISKLVELALLREEQLSKFLDIQSSLLSTSLSNLMNSREDKILEKLQTRLREFCKLLGQPEDELPKSENDLFKKLKELVEVTESRIKGLEGEIKSKRVHASRQVNEQLPMSIQRWLNGEDDSESDGELTPRRRGSRGGVEVASPIKPSKNGIEENWTPHPLRHKSVGFDDPNFYFVMNNDERISLDIDEKEERFISSPLAKKLETRYKAILAALRDDVLRVKSISDVIPKVRSIMEHNAQMYSFIFSLINITNYNGEKKFGYFLLDGEKVIDLDGLYLDIIWYRRLYEKLKKELVNSEETEQSQLYYKMKAAIVELKKQTKVFGNNHEANEERDVIARLKKTLNVQYTHDIVEECENLVSQLEKYVRIFPKFQSLINELCIGLNVKRIEDVIPSVKRLVKMSKNVNLLL